MTTELEKRVLRESIEELSPEEISKIWAEGAVVLDTSALLNFYEYSPDTVDQVLSALESVKARCWMPHQVQLEFGRMRAKKIVNAVETYRSPASLIRKVFQDLESQKGHPYVGGGALGKFRKAAQEFEAVLSEAGDVAATREDKDDLLARIGHLFEDRLGSEPTSQQLQAWYDDGLKRNHLKIPPGYKDEKKELRYRYGDLIIWMQVIDFCHESKRGLLFITADEKADWWETEAGSAKTPNKLLSDEFYCRTSRKCMFYTPSRFLEEAYKRGLIQRMSASAIEQVDAAQAATNSRVARIAWPETHHSAMGEAWKDLESAFSLATSIETGLEPPNPMRGKYASYKVLSEEHKNSYSALKDFMETSYHQPSIGLHGGTLAFYIEVADRLTQLICDKYGLTELAVTEHRSKLEQWKLQASLNH